MTDQPPTVADPLDARRRRATYRAAHRGTKEMDILLSKYADAHLAHFDEAALTRFEQFLSLPDPDLQGWFFAPETVEGLEFADIIMAVRRFHGLTGAEGSMQASPGAGQP
ncbi:MAG: succinate dehydrogenase assembly factor 2 [Hyphomicrobium aestuarii]|nr:succinate dehydrogenase assembly factor 2 [Hyphomicrobium aestuarii]